MNERIRELYNKASVYAYEQNPGENSYGRPVDENKYEEDRYTKFAELIVRECALAIINDSRLNDVRSAANGCVRTINEHFGVEK